MAKSKGPTPKQHRIKLAVIPKPAEGTRSVLVYDGEGSVVMRGDDPSVRVIMECGACGAELTRGVRTGQLENLVLRCKPCGAYNETLGGS